MRADFLCSRAIFTKLKVAQQALDEWQSATAGAVTEPVGGDQRAGSDWVSRQVTTNGVVCVSWQQVSLGRYYAGSRCDVHVDGRSVSQWHEMALTGARQPFLGRRSLSTPAGSIGKRPA
jgi:hypothetical protein